MTEIMIGELAKNWLSQNFRYTAEDAIELAEGNDWNGFEFIAGSDGEPLAFPGDYLTGHFCEWALDQSNAEAAMKALEEASGTYSVSAFAGCLAYDAGNEAAHAEAERIANALGHYPVLNDEDFGDRAMDNARETLTDSYVIPEELVEDVLSAILDSGSALCTDCNLWDVDSIMSGLGYTQCAECVEWLRTSVLDPVCFECSEIYGEGDAVCLVVDTAKHNGAFPTQDELREAEDSDLEAEDDDEDC